MSNSYVKQGFKDGQVLHAEHLIKMEEGIIGAMAKIEEILEYIDDNIELSTVELITVDDIDAICGSDI